MSVIVRTFTFTDGTDALGSEVETEIATIYDAWNNHDDGTSTFTSPKAVTLDLTGDAPGTPIANRLYADTIVKCWMKAEVSGGTPAISLDVNFDSITDEGTGDFTLVITTDFDSAEYAIVGNCVNAHNLVIRTEAQQAVGSFRILTIQSSTESAVDTSAFWVICVGPQ